MNILLIDPGPADPEPLIEQLASEGPVTLAEPHPSESALDSASLLVVGSEWLRTRANPDWASRALSGSSTPIVVLTPETEPSELGELLGRGVRHVVHMCSPYAGRDLSATVGRLLRSELPSPDHFVGPDHTSRVMNLRSSADRRDLMALTAEFAAALTKRSRHRQRVLTVLDELVTNALHHAPVDAEGRPRYSHLPRTADVEADKEIRVHLISDGRRLGIRVGDAHGSLRPDAVHSMLGGALRGAATGATENGGAGVGLFVVLDAASHLLIDVKPGKRTDVTAFLDLEAKFDDESRLCKSFNLFSTGA